MAARKGYNRKPTGMLTDEHRAKIGKSNILNALIEHTLGKREMSATQVTAALGLLRKCLPDLSAVEHQGEVASFVMRLPEPAVDTATWEQGVSRTLASTDTTKH
jgi:hypothetical protein